MKIGDKISLKHDNYATFEMERVNGQKIKRIVDVNNQPVADDMGVGKYYSKYKDANSVLKVAILDNGVKVPVKQIKTIKENKMTQNQEKKLTEAIRSMIKKILREESDATV